MSQYNDEDTRSIARQAHDQVTTYLTHFTRPDATWESFRKADTYLEYLKVHLAGLLHTVETELQERGAVEPTDYGT